MFYVINEIDDKLFYANVVWAVSLSARYGINQPSQNLSLVLALDEIAAGLWQLVVQISVH